MRLKKSTTVLVSENGFHHFILVSALKYVIGIPWTAIQSLRSSPGGSKTAARRLIPELNEACA